jgi:hypothetical protein
MLCRHREAPAKNGAIPLSPKSSAQMFSAISRSPTSDRPESLRFCSGLGDLPAASSTASHHPRSCCIRSDCIQKTRGSSTRMEPPWGGPPSGGFQERRPTRSRSGWRADIDLVPLGLGHLPPQRVMFIFSQRLPAGFSIASLNFPFCDSVSILTPLEK